MNGTMKCIVKTSPAPGCLELQEKPIPSPVADEVLIKVQLAAICGTDLHIKEWAEFAAVRMTPPVTVGHEFCGEIVEVMPLSQATVSQHLKVLKDAGLITGEVDGPRSCYCIDTKALSELRDSFLGLFGELENCC